MKEGLVLKSTGSWYTVKSAKGDIVQCTIRGKFRMDGIKSTNPVAVGDHVVFNVPENQETGVITKILDRKNYIIRKSSNLSKQSHIIAANLDQAILMVTINYPETYPIFIDRFLITCEAYQIPAIIIFNKTDLYNEEELQKLKMYSEIYSGIGYQSIHTSVKSEKNIMEVKNLLKDKTSLISGNSGVGKSSLINLIDNKLDLKIASISDYHKSGKHTTTFAEMFELEFGGYVIDTPGIRGFGLIHFEKDELYHFFPEIFKASKFCKYHNCLHLQEPGCAIKEAVAEGMISELRYNNYISIFFDEESKHRL